MGHFHSSKCISKCRLKMSAILSQHVNCLIWRYTYRYISRSVLSISVISHGDSQYRDKTVVGRLYNGTPYARKATYFYRNDVIKWKHFPRYWPVVRGIHRSPVKSPHKGQWRGALIFSLTCARINDWVNNREAGDLRRHRAHHDVTVMLRRVPGNHICIMIRLIRPSFLLCGFPL